MSVVTTVNYEVAHGIVFKNTYEDDRLVVSEVAGGFITLLLDGADVGTINVPMLVTISYQDYQGNALPDEASSITVEVTTDGKIVGTMLLNPVNGVATFSFVAEHSGTYVITAKCNDKPSTPGDKVVMINA